MAKKCKTKEDIIIRKKAFDRLMRMRNCVPGIPPLEIYGLKANRTGVFTLDELVSLCE